jgi:hypothetical protein
VTNERFRAYGGFCSLIEGDSDVIASMFPPGNVGVYQGIHKILHRRCTASFVHIQ